MEYRNFPTFLVSLMLIVTKVTLQLTSCLQQLSNLDTCCCLPFFHAMYSCTIYSTNSLDVNKFPSPFDKYIQGKLKFVNNFNSLLGEWYKICYNCPFTDKFNVVFIHFVFNIFPSSCTRNHYLSHALCFMRHKLYHIEQQKLFFQNM